ncbi:hypothetical protein L3X38_012078 [Prunus dulcis]|uniref:Protein kinase domain-containing protein n=1 Tax=Prunus dulcis TaxID=3755 RepID=A0AAD4WJD0_PRUDU|nr:hypothetical protein L3X38_012078 [Prunus dulcis]
MKELPSVREAYSLIIQEEKQREIGSPVTEGVSIATAVKTQKGAGSSYYRSGNQTSFRGTPISSESTLHCTYCNQDHHTVDRCYKLHGYPPGHKLYRGGSNPPGHANTGSASRNGFGSKWHASSSYANQVQVSSPAAAAQTEQTSTASSHVDQSTQNLKNILGGLSVDQCKQLAAAMTITELSNLADADIKRITNDFKDKLGEGAYGTVYKGMLSSELFVAVKVLHSSKGDGEEFITEVGTLGHIHHVNVIRLVGFCADGFRRALVYEFLPNGSLQDFISSPDKKNSFLGWDKMQDIALAIAKGIEYLHQGCDQRILHFDIKPYNILLDHNFTPKISDFGLAKLCSKDQSIVSMTTARGTMGYIAPEVFSRNFGNVSYSFGMLLLEMVGGRKNVSSATENTNEIYYPEWIYNLLEEGDDLRIHIGEEGEGKIPKKLAIVGLWCIQWHPGDRPSMKAVIQMLEGGECLTMPPNPFASTGAAGTNASTAARNLNIQLEAIPELE